jgi:hypothetical protein
LGFVSTCRTVASRLSNSIGLASNSSHPVAMAFSRSLASAYADMPMIGMCRVRGSFLRVRTGSQRHFEVHQNYVRALSYSQLAALLAVISRENLEIAAPLKACLQHVEVLEGRKQSAPAYRQRFAGNERIQSHAGHCSSSDCVGNLRVLALVLVLSRQAVLNGGNRYFRKPNQECLGPFRIALVNSDSSALRSPWRPRF